jgi:hypothetical protein
MSAAGYSPWTWRTRPHTPRDRSTAAVRRPVAPCQLGVQWSLRRRCTRRRAGWPHRRAHNGLLCRRADRVGKRGAQAYRVHVAVGPAIAAQLVVAACLLLPAWRGRPAMSGRYEYMYSNRHKHIVHICEYAIAR